MVSNARFIKSQFMAKHFTATPIKLQRLEDCLHAMRGVIEIQRARVVTSNIQRIAAK